jgi:hypothetical protein
MGLEEMEMLLRKVDHTEEERAKLLSGYGFTCVLAEDSLVLKAQT